MRTGLFTAGLASVLGLIACGGGSKAVRKPDWVGTSSGIYEDGGKWYYQIEKVNGGTGLKRRQNVDKKVTDAAQAACKDAKPEDIQIIDHFVDVDTGAEQAVARIDAAKCADAAAAAAPAGEEKPAEGQK